MTLKQSEGEGELRIVFASECPLATCMSCLYSPAFLTCVYSPAFLMWFQPHRWRDACVNAPQMILHVLTELCRVFLNITKN